MDWANERNTGLSGLGRTGRTPSNWTGRTGRNTGLGGLERTGGLADSAECGILDGAD